MSWDTEWAGERDLDRLIERRSRRDPDPDELEPSYASSVRRYNAAREAERRAAWCEYHRQQAGRLRRTLEPLIAFHEARAADLLQGSPEGVGANGPMRLGTPGDPMSLRGPHERSASAERGRARRGA